MLILCDDSDHWGDISKEKISHFLISFLVTDALDGGIRKQKKIIISDSLFNKMDIYVHNSSHPT